MKGKTSHVASTQVVATSSLPSPFFSSLVTHHKIKTGISVRSGTFGGQIRSGKTDSKYTILREGILTTTTSKGDKNQPLCDNSYVSSMVNKQKENPRTACSKLPGTLERVERDMGCQL